MTRTLYAYIVSSAALLSYRFMAINNYSGSCFDTVVTSLSLPAAASSLTVQDTGFLCINGLKSHI